jgi:hypothetical protein
VSAKQNRDESKKTEKRSETAAAKGREEQEALEARERAETENINKIKVRDKQKAALKRKSDKSKGRAGTILTGSASGKPKGTTTGTSTTPAGGSSAGGKTLLGL